nr:TrmO family methyltransferase [uncultured Holophaga sp.]
MLYMPGEPVSIRPIGVVISDFRDFDQANDFEQIRELRLRQDLELALAGLEAYSHIYVFYHQHRRQEWQQAVGWSDSPEQLLTLPQAKDGNLRGIYTSRAPARPSGMGSCVCELVRREGRRLFVRGLDAFDGSAILDIKIYVPSMDAVPHATGPLHCRPRRSADPKGRVFPWGTLNREVTLGVRTGLRAMEELGLGRGEATRAEMVGGSHFARSIERITGCVLPGQWELREESGASLGSWRLRLLQGGKGVEIRLRDHPAEPMEDLMALSDECLFSEVRAL